MKRYLKSIGGVVFFLINIIIGNCCYADVIAPRSLIEEYGKIIFVLLVALTLIAIVSLAVSNKKEDSETKNNADEEEDFEKKEDIDN